jgi:hypothetical protein
MVNLSQHWSMIQGTLFPWLREELDPLTEKHQQLVTVLEAVRVEQFIQCFHGLVGHPLSDRRAIGRAFIAKAIYDLPTTEMLIERLHSDMTLRRICGWERRDAIASAATFSRAFAEFAQSQLPERMHTALIKQNMASSLVGHIARDATAIEAREKPLRKSGESTADAASALPKRGRPKKGEDRSKNPTRLERQQTMSLLAMVADLPKDCDVGTKKNSQGYKESWTGYKMHIDTADGGIPISCLLTSASVHDSQVALPLATMTAQRVTSLYDLMDAAYDSVIIAEHSQRLGHVPIIDANPRRGEKVPMDPATARRYCQRSESERINSRLKDSFGGRHVRVRGHAKVMAHLMFGVIALTVDQLLRLLT